MKHQLTHSELLEHLNEQLYFLDISLTNFVKYEQIDKLENKYLGNPFDINLPTDIEAKRIATTVRVLVHDTDNSHSLFTQLDIKEKIKYVNSCIPNDGCLHSMTGMVGVCGSRSDNYYGLVAKINKKKLIALPLYNQHLKDWYKSYQNDDFRNWWNCPIMNVNGNEFSRKDIILNIANKDGGAHIDSNLPEKYYNTKNVPLSLIIMGNKANFDRNTVYASAAQIGWELLNSIDNSINK